MFKILQVFSIFALIIILITYNYKFAKKKLKNQILISLSIYLVIIGLVSNVYLETIPLPTEVVTITALGEKNEKSLADEVKLELLNISGDKYTDFTPIDGKWMLNEKYHYMWRNELDPRQPDGLTRQIKVEVPLGLERLLTFAASDTSGMVRVEFAGETQIVDLYSKDNTIKQVEVTATPNSKMQMIKVGRLCYWYIAMGLILLVSAIVVHLYKKYPNFKNVIPLTVIILLQVGVMIYYGDQKEGFHLDEIYTYSLSNRAYEKHNAMTYNEWITSDYYREYLTVDENNRYNYDSVYYNQTLDVHPPVYYFLIHTVSSISPNYFSKWIGIGLNIVFNIFNTILLFKISSRIFKQDKLKWLPVLLWGFSIACISSVIFIRMYVIMTFATLLFVYNYINNVHEKEMTNKTILLTFVATYIGCMTQYYFLIFAFIFTFIISAVNLIRQRYKEMFKYGLSVTAGVVMLFVTFPSAYNDMLGSGYRGTEAFDNATDLSRILPNLTIYFNSITKQIYGESIGKLLFYLMLALLAWIVFNKFICNITFICPKDGQHIRLKCEWFKQKEVSFNVVNTNFIVATLSILVVVYVATIALIAPYTVMRYIYCVLPFSCIAFVYWINVIINCVKVNEIVSTSLTTALVLVCLTLGVKNVNPDFLYTDAKYMTAYSVENSNLNAVGILENHMTLFPFYEDIKNYNSVISVNYDNIAILNDKINQLENSEKIMLYLPKTYKDLLPEIIEIAGYNDYEELYTYSNRTIYRLSGRE